MILWPLDIKQTSKHSIIDSQVPQLEIGRHVATAHAFDSWRTPRIRDARCRSGEGDEDRHEIHCQEDLQEQGVKRSMEEAITAVDRSRKHNHSSSQADGMLAKLTRRMHSFWNMCENEWPYVWSERR